MKAAIIVASAVVHAPIERVFALSTRVELVQRTLGMRPVGGVVRGHVGAGSRVVWRGWKFGWPTEHHTLITRFEPPAVIELPSGPAMAAFFQDTQERGRFAAFHHDHFFREVAGGSGDAEGLRVEADDTDRSVQEADGVGRDCMAGAEGAGCRSDSMTEGADVAAPRTMLRDEIHFALPLGWVGRVVARLVMAPYVRALARRRFAMIRELAEGEGWREWVG